MTQSNQFPTTVKNNQIQKTVHGLTSLERLSTTDRQIVEANHQVKIRQFEGDTKNFKVLHVIASVEKLLDTTESPTYEAKKELLTFLVENYSHLSPEEMICAVKLNLTGTYGEVIKCFNKIDIQYLTSCFNKYNDFKQRAILAHKAAIEADKDRQPKQKATPEQSYNFIKKFVEENNKLPITADWSSCFDYMWAQKLTDSSEELKKFFDKHSEIYIKNIKSKIATSTNFVEKHALQFQISESAIKTHVRKVWVQLYFQNSLKT